MARKIDKTTTSPFDKGGSRGISPSFSGNSLGTLQVLFKSGFTQRRDDATRGYKGVGLMLVSYELSLYIL
jgi:hypothetical protein